MHIARSLILLITPTDRHRDAQRLSDAGLRVIATSRAESSLRQVFDAQPAVVAIEWLPSLATETLAYLQQLTVSARSRPVAVLVYGSATPGLEDEVARWDGEWVEVTDDHRDLLVQRAADCAAFSPSGSGPSVGLA